MEIIELTSENIDRYLDDCVDVQQYLVKPGTPIDPDQFIKTAASDNAYFVGVIDGGSLVGLGAVNKIVWPVRTAVFVDNIVVHPDARGKGAFTIIMEELENKAKEWEVQEIVLSCSREEVWPLYEKRGYSQKNTRLYIKKI